MSVGRDQKVARIAANQRGLVTSEQLAACGIGKDAVAHRVLSGRLHPVFHTVYSVGCGELLPLGRESAALLACPGSFLSHRSAAFVWGMQKNAPVEVEVSIVGRCRRSRNGLRVHRITAIDRRELWREEGLWVSSPARAVLEIAAIGSREELVEAVDQGLALRRFSPRDLEAVLARNRGRRGAGRLAALVGDESAMAISRSRAEKALLRLIRDARLPVPETNVPFGRYEADFVWREQRLIVELDSGRYHSGPGVVHRDREKDLLFRDHGFDVLRFMRAHVVYAPSVTLVRLTRALARREPG